MPGYRGHVAAAVDEICHALATYGVLTHNGLQEVCHTDRWHDTNLDAALHDARRAGRVRFLTGDLYELTDAERAI
jgi:hypothetical protein